MTPEERREIRSDLDIADNLLRLCWDNFKATEPTFVLRDLIVIEFDRIRREAEQAAYERAAKVAEQYNGYGPDGRCLTGYGATPFTAASDIAESIRALGKQEA
ncbi:hypothetical protein [Hyphomicrobium sp. DMF-1]|uniref:hypothetical protein n=1 Tax=Hyphomicrobium sp. DMF-1 TaxID=3019544 RepID=UPI0022EBE5DC|nr:hypothetical protein [Hyphomicrobium sp. DMF-1]WBT40122.1 hypothetical protein PE058_09640 [Hyphomicrobium sp. DMF-1]